jgi:hypothetical protein
VVSEWRITVPPLQLYGSVGPEEENNPEDVTRVGNSLFDLGLTGARDAAHSGAWDNSLDASVKSFQETNGLEVDGILLPGGPTQATINRSLESRRDAFRPRASDTLDRPSSESERASSGDEADALRNSPRNIIAARNRSSENRVAADNGELDPVHEDTGWWRGDSDLPRLSDRVAKVMTASPRQRDTQSGNFLKLLGQSPLRSAAPGSVSSDSDAGDRILAARGYRYVPDPMGRVGWGDWVDGEGKFLDESRKQAILARENSFGENIRGRDNEGTGEPKIPLPQVPHAIETPPRRLSGLNSAQAAVVAQSEIGGQIAEAEHRIRQAALKDGQVPASVWHDELRRLGVEPGQIGAPSAGVTLVQHGGDPKKSTPDAKRTPESFVGKAWSWLTEEFPGLAEQKAQAIERLDSEIRAIEAEPGWRRNVLSLIARQSLLEARTGIIAGFPTSRLDFALAGIDLIGVGWVGGRPLTILRKGNKIITSSDLAEGGFRSRQALDLGKDVPYDSHLIRTWLERRYGAEAVTSSTIPSADFRFIQLAGKRHPVTGVVFDTRGYPIFDDIARFDTRIPSDIFWKGRVDMHKQAAMLQLREAVDSGQVSRHLFTSDQLRAIYQGKSDIPGYRWHHHQDLGRMQLVPEAIHSKTLHLGGMGLRKGQ